MKFHLVARTAQSGFIGQLSAERIVEMAATDQLKLDYVVTESTEQSYDQLMRSGKQVTWTPLSDFLAVQPPYQKRQEAEFRPTIAPQPSMGILIFACALLAAFFMPWFQLFGTGLSGYQVGRLGSYGNWAWIIPILAGATIIATLARQNNRLLGVFAGAVPLLAIIYAIIRISAEAGANGSGQFFDVAGHVLSIGAYLTIISSIGLLISSIIEPTIQVPPIQPAQPVDRLAQLERLARLREQGALSETEFKTQKSQILE